MRSVTSYFKISPAVIKDDFRRFWALPVIAFVFYFFSTIFYILMNLKTIDEEYTGLPNFIDTVLSGQYVPNIFNVIWLSLLSVLLVFRYLHNSGHVIAIHSQPFTRATLINSHTVSCILFIALPVILTGIILLIVAQPCYYPQNYYDSAEDMINVFARINIIKWMLESLIVGLFIMAVSIAAGMVTGTSFHHAVAAIGFNGVVPLCMVIAMLYGEVYLFGFTTPEWLNAFIKHTTPLAVMIDDRFMSAGMCVYFIVLTILIYALAMFLYYKRKLEKATDGIVFKAVDVLITFIFGYLGMTGMGMTFYSMFNRSAGVTAVGYIAGALLGIIIVRMVILKSIKIFNKKTIIITGSYLIAALAFFGCLNFDVAGYESRIPADADEAYISLSNSLRYDLTSGKVYTEQETIDAVKEFNRFIVENKDICEEVAANNWKDDNYYEDTVIVNIHYNKGSGDDSKKIQSRSYSVPVYLLAQSQEFKDMLECSEFADKAVEDMPSVSSISYVNIYSGYYEDTVAYGSGSASEGKIMCVDKAKIAELMKALEQDYRTMSAEDIINNYNLPAVGRLSVLYNSKAENGSKKGTDGETALIERNGAVMIEDEFSEDFEGQAYVVSDADSSMEIRLTPAYRNTINWINSSGYGDLIKYNESYWSFAKVYEFDGSDMSHSSDKYDEGENSDKIPESTDEMTVVTDPAKINLMYHNARSHSVYGDLRSLSTAENDLYYVMFYRAESSDEGLQTNYVCSYIAYAEGKYVR